MKSRFAKPFREVPTELNSREMCKAFMHRAPCARLFPVELMDGDSHFMRKGATLMHQRP